ncbi:MAG: peptidase S9 [Planctomycetes bacterium]|nr:peptidase S9 [Planctomycetota bacterium]
MIRSMRTLRCLVIVVSMVAGLAAQKVLTPEILNTLGRVGSLTLAPDGKHLLFTVSTPDLAANKGSTELFLLNLTEAGRRPAKVGSGRSPCWLRGGVEFAWQTEGVIKIRHLYEDGPDRTIQLDGPVANLHFSPGSDRFSFTRNVKLEELVTDRYADLPEAHARAYDDLLIRHWDHWHDGTFSHLFVQAAGAATSQDLMGEEKVHTPLQPFGGAEQIAWSPDGKELCYTARRVPDPEASTDSSLWTVSADGGAHKNLTEGMPGYDQEPRYSPDGRWIAFSSMERAGFEADRVRLVIHDRESGRNAELLPDFDASPHDVTWSSDSKQLFFTVDVEGTTQIYVTPLEGARATAVTTGRHRLYGIQPTPDAGTIYCMRTTTERAAEVVKVDVASGAVAAVTDVNGAAYADMDLPQVDAEWFEATDGKRIHAWIVKPPNFDPKKKYPMLLYCQGGPQSMVGQWFSYRWNFHLMAAQGYVVAAVNRRGLPGFGQAWNDQISKDWGGQAMADLLTVCDQVKARDYVDEARVGAVGASFGGYSVYWLMGNGGDRFACMISHCGVFNLESMYLATEELFFVNWDLGGPFWVSSEVADLYRKFSPHRYVKNWKTPLLVIHGERDYRVPYDQGLQAFTAAQVQGVPSRILVFPDEGHWVLQPQNGVLWQREFFGWLDRWCKAK